MDHFQGGTSATGKSSIGRVLGDHTNNKSCVINNSTENRHTEVVVFNSDYIRANFEMLDVQRGIFTIGEDNIEDKKRVISLEKEREELIKMSDELRVQSDESEEQYCKIREEVKETLFEVKREYEHTNLAFCLDGKRGNKEVFLQFVLGVSLNDEKGNKLEVDYSFNDLENEVLELGEEDQESIPLIELLDNPFDCIGKNSIWDSVIIGNSDSYLSNLIERVNNSDWVKKGIKFLENTDNKCPFCQRTMGDTIIAELKSIFDDEFTRNEELVQRYSKEYQSEIDKIENMIIDDNAKKYIIDDYAEKLIRLLGLLKENSGSIQSKVRQLSKRVTVKSVQEYMQDVNNCIIKSNNRIKDINKRIKNRKETKDRISARFWSLVRQKYNNEIIRLKSEEKSKESVCGSNINDQKAISGKLLLINKEIENINARKTGIEESLANINNNIQVLGMIGFEVVSVGTNNAEYRLTRSDGDREKIFHTLSDGEKEIIAFLYFIETCKGSLKKESINDLASKVIIIDDPISSLSHNNIFEIADLIKRTFSYRDESDNLKLKLLVNQLFILTHDLYFYHEIVKILADQRKGTLVKLNYFRVLKVGSNSNVVSITKDEIKNSYEEYWMEYFRLKNSNVSSYVLPNIMRQIIEHYFGFIRVSDKYGELCEELLEAESDINIKSFIRCINRESHSDRINNCEWKRLDLQKAHEIFKRIFDELGHIQHYNYMESECSIV